MYSISLARDVDPTSLHALQRAIDDARREHAALLIVRLDTPGGEAVAMREMVKAIAGAPLPVVVYVHPRGARADSAGVPLALAADVAAMTPRRTSARQPPCGPVRRLARPARIGHCAIGGARRSTAASRSSARLPRITAATPISPSAWCARRRTSRRSRRARQG